VLNLNEHSSFEASTGLADPCDSPDDVDSVGWQLAAEILLIELLEERTKLFAVEHLHPLPPDPSPVAGLPAVLISLWLKRGTGQREDCGFTSAYCVPPIIDEKAQDRRSFCTGKVSAGIFIFAPSPDRRRSLGAGIY
jgi:hypothetical protein